MAKAPSRCSGRGLRGRAGGVVFSVSPCSGPLFGGDFGDGGAVGGFVDDCFVRGEVATRACRARLVAAADELDVVGEVVAGLGVGHAGQMVLLSGSERRPCDSPRHPNDPTEMTH